MKKQVKQVKNILPDDTQALTKGWYLCYYIYRRRKFNLYARYFDETNELSTKFKKTMCGRSY